MEKLTDGDYPCETCGMVGCVIWMKYVLQIGKPPLTPDQKEKGTEMMRMFKDVLSHTGCRHWVESEFKRKMVKKS